MAQSLVQSRHTSVTQRGEAEVAATSAPPELPFTDVLGLRISAINMPTAVATIERWIQERARQYVCICGVHGVMEGQRDPALLQVMNGAGLRTPDGMPMVWLSRRAGHDWVDRVYGPDLMLALCDRSRPELRGIRHFFYGGTPGVADELAARLQARFPGLQVAGTHCPPMLPVGAIEDDATIQTINDAQADIVWVGLSTPKQDWWVANHRPMLNAPVLIAVGAAFDFHSGRVRQAPVWIQAHGLEWLFRLSQDPKRLWRRYAVANTGFIARLLRVRLREATQRWVHPGTTGPR